MKQPLKAKKSAHAESNQPTQPQVESKPPLEAKKPAQAESNQPAQPQVESNQPLECGKPAQAESNQPTQPYVESKQPLEAKMPAQAKSNQPAQPRVETKKPHPSELNKKSSKLKKPGMKPAGFIGHVTSNDTISPMNDAVTSGTLDPLKTNNNNKKILPSNTNSTMIDGTNSGTPDELESINNNNKVGISCTAIEAEKKVDFTSTTDNVENCEDTFSPHNDEDHATDADDEYLTQEEIVEFSAGINLLTNNCSKEDDASLQLLMENTTTNDCKKDVFDVDSTHNIIKSTEDRFLMYPFVGGLAIEKPPKS